MEHRIEEKHIAVLRGVWQCVFEERKQFAFGSGKLSLQFVLARRFHFAPNA